MSEIKKPDLLVCKECGGQDVELQCWKNQLTGMVDDSGATDDVDTWCNDCQDHLGVKYVADKS